MNKAKTYASVWDALADTPAQCKRRICVLAPSLCSRLRPLSKKIAGRKPGLRNAVESLSRA